MSNYCQFLEFVTVYYWKYPGGRGPHFGQPCTGIWIFGNTTVRTSISPPVRKCFYPVMSTQPTHFPAMSISLGCRRGLGETRSLNMIKWPHQSAISCEVLCKVYKVCTVVHKMCGVWKRLRGERAVPILLQNLYNQALKFTVCSWQLTTQPAEEQIYPPI